SSNSEPSASQATLITTGNSTSNKISVAYFLTLGASFQNSHTQTICNSLQQLQVEAKSKTPSLSLSA
ncbi:MAG: hypothetical protein ABSG03_38210, partial [Bryobacteraceae bacterium]